MKFLTYLTCLIVMVLNWHKSKAQFGLNSAVSLATAATASAIGGGPPFQIEILNPLQVPKILHNLAHKVAENVLPTIGILNNHHREHQNQFNQNQFNQNQFNSRRPIHHTPFNQFNQNQQPFNTQRPNQNYYYGPNGWHYNHWSNNDYNPQINEPFNGNNFHNFNPNYNNNRLPNGQIFPQNQNYGSTTSLYDNNPVNLQPIHGPGTTDITHSHLIIEEGTNPEGPILQDVTTSTAKPTSTAKTSALNPIRELPKRNDVIYPDSSLYIHLPIAPLPPPTDPTQQIEPRR